VPDNTDQQESQEIKDNNTLTEKGEDDTIKRMNVLQDKINDYYLKRREPLKEDPVFEEFEKINKMVD